MSFCVKNLFVLLIVIRINSCLVLIRHLVWFFVLCAFIIVLCFVLLFSSLFLHVYFCFVRLLLIIFSLGLTKFGPNLLLITLQSNSLAHIPNKPKSPSNQPKPNLNAPRPKPNLLLKHRTPFPYAQGCQTQLPPIQARLRPRPNFDPKSTTAQNKNPNSD